MLNQQHRSQAMHDSAHFVLTRFNVRSIYHKAEPTDEWLLERLRLFRKYCLPTLSNQTESNFTWIVYLDSKSPDWFRREIDELSAEGVFEPVYLEGRFSADAVSRSIAERTSASTVVTTRVDNDDAVARDFVEVIQSCVDAQSFEFINLVNGSQYADGKVYIRPYTQNPFVSLIERPGESAPATVFIEHHFKVQDKGPVRNVSTAHPMWLQVVHGGNVLNEIVGLRVAGSRIANYFDCQLDVADAPVALLAERVQGVVRIGVRLLRKPARVRELARSMFASKAPVSGHR